jgi:cytochrome c556
VGFRLQRSIKIAKGVRLNVSKSGLGVSVGPRGLGISAGPRGVYAHAGIPGSGLSVRGKIGSSSQGSSSQSSRASEAPSTVGLDVRIEIDDETGKESVLVSLDGRPVTDESLIRKVKRDPAFKAKLQEVREQVHSKTVEGTEVLISIHQHTEAATDWQAVEAELSQAIPQVYEKREFSIPAPDPERIRADLAAEAKRTVKGLFGMKKKREAYVAERVEDEVTKHRSAWEAEKAAFEASEARQETEKNTEYQKQFDAWKAEITSLLEPIPTFIEQRLEDLFTQIQLPIDFSLSFEVRDSGKTIALDVDLPEIEDYPTKKSKLLASGKVSIKDKTQKEIKQDYLYSVIGIAFYFASIAFNAANGIERVQISGYTQRIDKQTGNETDDYVYSVIFPAQALFQLNFQNIDPVQAILGFDPVIDIGKTGDLKTITPLP